MAEIKASMVTELRTKTGAGMMDCKKALIETNGDMQAAIDFLRKKGLDTASKKSSRTAAQGLTAVALEGNKAAVVELNSETDFVASNQKFRSLVQNIAKAAINLNSNDLEALKSQVLSNGKKVSEDIVEHIAIIGENMNLRRVAVMTIENGVISSYVHNSVEPNLGKISVLVALESSADKAKLEEFGRQIAMHIAAAKPDCLDITGVNPEALQREKNIFADQAKASGKPDSIIEKMVEGRIRKYYEEVVLLEQIFVIDSKTKVSDVVASKAKELGTDIKIKAFERFALGEGIEVAETDFAAEVAQVAKS